MGILFGYAPWVLYWVLVGNIPFTVAVLVALAIAVAALVVRRGVLQLGAVATFLVLTVLTLILGQVFLERWILPLSNAGIVLVALSSVVIGKPFMREFAGADLTTRLANTDLFARVTTLLTWFWVAVFAAMTVSSSIPPIMDADASILERKTPLSFLGYWLIPFALLGLAVLASRILLDRMTAGADDVVRKTSFVAYSEATIDELYYLAQEHANREVGPGQVAYEVKVGAKGEPLTGDESRLSWPSTYKVRQRRR
ncbi:hypothetical protein [Mycobacterium noviomagense]|uniref:Uncharacterized protein n=1 Tax=Mycobacterium noviomagense TaxID=459858 RepID=A0A7I7PEP8_9MYCO|nr:hypothetical protein [Mycobacterium noviomagense]ORB12673.1 hypothetical protein BST37_15610 [Mycobacterium noviomagense]BBY07088.1 hypothetical protein MNVI_24060 [Mycobacterium noviomagense]